MEMPYNSEVLFDAPKLFWRTRNTMDVMLVEHFADNAIEVIAYEPSFDKEAPRLYVNNDVLLSILDTASMEKRIEDHKEQMLRRHITPDNEAVRLDVSKAMKVEFLLTRIIVDEFNLDERKVAISLQTTHLETLLYKGKPVGVRRHRSPHFKPLMEGAVDAMLEKLATEHASIDQLCEEAIGRTAAAQENVLSAQELWRVPLLYSKKLRGRRLSSEDEQTWRTLVHRVVQGLPTDSGPVTAISEALHQPMEENTQAEVGETEEFLSTSAFVAASPRRVRGGLQSQTVASQMRTSVLSESKENKAKPRGRTVARLQRKPSDVAHASSTNSLRDAMSGFGQMLRNIPSGLGLLASGESADHGSSKKVRRGSILLNLLPNSLRSSFFAPQPEEIDHQPKAPVVLHPTSLGSENNVTNEEKSVAATTEVWFHGPKLFWKTKNTSDVLIVHHSTSSQVGEAKDDSDGVVEVIVYEPTLDKEAPRLYVNMAALYARLDQSEIASKLVQEKEIVLRRHSTPNSAQMLQKIVRQAKLDYLLNRLVIIEFEIATKGFTVGLQCTYRDAEGTGASKLLLDHLPEGLRRYQPVHSTGAQGGFRGVVTSLLALLNADRQAVQTDLDRAEGLQIKSRASLSVGEKWRIPLIYRRVATGKPLNDRDAAVWHALSDSIKLNAATEATYRGVSDGSAVADYDGEKNVDEVVVFGIADALGATVNTVQRSRPALHLPKYDVVTHSATHAAPINATKKAATTPKCANRNKPSIVSTSEPHVSSNPNTPNSSRPSSCNNSLRRMSSGTTSGAAAASPKKSHHGHNNNHSHAHPPTHGSKRVGAAATPKRRSHENTTSTAASVSFDLPSADHAASSLHEATDLSAVHEQKEKITHLVPLSRVGSVEELTMSCGLTSGGGYSFTAEDWDEAAAGIPCVPTSTPMFSLKNNNIAPNGAISSSCSATSPSRRRSLTFDLLQAVRSKLTLPFPSSQKVHISAPVDCDE